MRKGTVFWKILRCKLTGNPYLQVLEPAEDLKKRCTQDLMNILKNYRELHPTEVTMILAELKLRE